MPTNIRRPLLIVAAVLGALQLRFLQFLPESIPYFFQTYSSVSAVLYTIGNLTIIPAAIAGIAAAARSGQPKTSRLLAGIAGGIAFGGVLAFTVADVLNDFSAVTSLKFNLGFASSDSYYSSNKIFILAGTLAMILWAVCAAVPDTETGSVTADSFGAPAYSPPSVFTSPQTPQTPTAVATPAPAATKQFCSGCGNMLAGSGKFCSSCGAQV